MTSYYRLRGIWKKFCLASPMLSSITLCFLSLITPSTYWTMLWHATLASMVVSFHPHARHVFFLRVALTFRSPQDKNIAKTCLRFEPHVVEMIMHPQNPDLWSWLLRYNLVFSDIAKRRFVSLAVTENIGSALMFASENSFSFDVYTRDFEPVFSWFIRHVSPFDPRATLLIHHASLDFKGPTGLTPQHEIARYPIWSSFMSKKEMRDILSAEALLSSSKKSTQKRKI